ncbi:unnamed protein product [Clonostachys solani]|uniref:Geranylgeranyl pyrophosphate synthetase n=1 Tax=Clonostachys solani TaxID=160281 RepID=A0A9P0EKS1_9HYPO|nr:unnamed protein product [Clonostachys solani]
MSYRRGYVSGSRRPTRGSRSQVGAWPRPHVSSLPSPPKGELLGKVNWDQLSSDAIASLPDGPIGIDHVAVIASYNWVGQDRPTIMVPGKPALWTPLDAPKPLTQDNGDTETYYVDPNAAYASKHALNPEVTAIMKMEPTCLEKPELVACGSTLGHLLRFAMKSDRPFRMLVQTVGSTVHLVRRLNSSTETIDDIKGYGHSFPNAYTTWEPEVKQSKSHQRVMRYQLGGLPTLIRYEGDGYISDTRRVMAKAKETGGDLWELFDDFHVGSGDKAYRRKDDELQVEDGGEEVAQETIFDLKTRSRMSAAGRDTLGEEIPRLWVRQIEKFILAFHNRGVFTDIQELDTRKRIDDWENENQEGLKRFMRCLHWVIDKATSKERSASEFELVCDGSDTLELREKLADAGDPLSDEVKQKWKDWLGETDEPSGGSRASPRTVGGSDWEKHGKTASSDDDDHYLASEHHEYDSPYEYDWSDVEDDKDLTACDKECGYCGKCPY